ncbi:MAG TPA: efflux RND transporter periplasmic adaptor subunit [bacterium]|nr:efflux RND transporter periplasmic adaptor subunit [bacterium]
MGVLALAALVSGGLMAWPYVEARLFKTEVTVTRIAMVSPVSASTTLTASGYVVPQLISKVAAKLPGRVATLLVREGDKVAKDQVLMTLDAADQISQLAQARSRVVAAQARVVAARATLAETELQLAREKLLSAAGVSPRSNMEDLQAHADSLRAALDAATSDVRVAQSDVEAAKVALENMTIRSPIAGTILDKPLQVGEVVGYSPSGALQNLVDVADLNTDMVEVDVPEARLHLVHLGAPCEITLDAFPGRRFRGEVAEFGKQVDRAKATLIVKVRFLDPKDGVLPDMAARVSFLTQQPTAEQLRAAGFTVIPANAVVTRSGAKGVLVVSDDDSVRWRPVSLGDALADGFVLKAGPPAGARIVSSPPPTLRDGMTIKERPER